MATVGDVMSTTLLTVDASALLTEAAALMDARGVGAALVVNGEHLSGILTERDVLRAVATGEVEGTKVGAWMTHDPETVAPDERPGHAAAIMLRGGFRHLVHARELFRCSPVPLEEQAGLALRRCCGSRVNR